MDHLIVAFLNQLAGSSHSMQGVTVFFAEYFPYPVIVLFVLCAYREAPIFYRRFLYLGEGLIAGVLARAGVEAIRFVVFRLRPFVADPAIHALISESSYSFPSGHAGFFFALATVVYAHNKRVGSWFFTSALLIGVARISAGVHYPSDILGGAVLGILVGYGVVRLVRTYFKSEAPVSASSN